MAQSSYRRHCKNLFSDCASYGEPDTDDDNATLSPLSPSIPSSTSSVTVSSISAVHNMVLIIVSSITVSVISLYSVVIIHRALKSSPSRRHLAVSQVLLLGLLLGSIVGIVYSTEETPSSCVLVRLGTGISYVLIYSSLLVKLVFLISLNTGVYLPAMYQALLLFFAVLVQIVISLEWLGLVSGCDYSPSDHLLSLTYIMFLVTLVSILSVKYKHIRDNYHEAYSIYILMLLTVPLWIAWVSCSLLLPSIYTNTAFGYGILVISLLTFLLMFLPRARQMVAMGKDELFSESDHLGHQAEYSAKASPKSHHVGCDSEPGVSSYLGFHRPLGVDVPAPGPVFHYQPQFSRSPHSRHGSQFYPVSHQRGHSRGHPQPVPYQYLVPPRYKYSKLDNYYLPHDYYGYF